MGGGPKVPWSKQLIEYDQEQAAKKKAAGEASS
ncbi:Protein transport protein GOT1 [Verticillium dahliae VDG2]|nr:Protein transport protein GOT1 [Verticillium dahliae VDG2]